MRLSQKAVQRVKAQVCMYQQIHRITCQQLDHQIFNNKTDDYRLEDIMLLFESRFGVTTQDAIIFIRFLA